MDGLVLFGLFALFLYYVYNQMKVRDSDSNTFQKKSNAKIWLLIIGGFAGLIIGGQLVVIYSIDLATTLGVSEKIIGITIVAAGTSLPELLTSVVAALKKNSDIAIGNVIDLIFSIFYSSCLSAHLLIRSILTQLSTSTLLYCWGAHCFYLSRCFPEKRKNWTVGKQVYYWVLCGVHHFYSC